MKLRICHFVLSASLLAFSQQAVADNVTGKDFLIGIDLSDSVQHTREVTQAKLVAQTVYKIARNGKYGDRIRLRSFGSYDVNKNPLRVDKVLSRRSRPRIVARNLYHIISRIPAQVKSGKLPTQKSTHLIAFLKDLASSLKCTPKKPGSVIIFSDGVESSHKTQINIRTGKITLPKPAKGLYKNCHFYIYGAGQLGEASDERITESVIRAWTLWAQQAGFTKIQIARVW